jgi:PKD repeat protein
LLEQTLSGVENGGYFIGDGWLGPSYGIDNGTRGTYYLDAFESRRGSDIGPEGVLANFTADVTSGSTPLTVNFTSLSQPSGQITGYDWDFGDGDSSIEQDPTHIYTQAGVFDVTLTVTDGTNFDTLTISSYIQATSADLIFADGFESGDLSAWSKVVDVDADLVVDPAAALVGSQGLAVNIDDNTSMYLWDKNPAGTKEYLICFYFVPNSISLANGDLYYMFSFLGILFYTNYFTDSIEKFFWICFDNVL